MSALEVGELFMRLLEEPSENLRLQLVKMLSRNFENALGEVARRVGGEAVPDTVVARTSVEAVVAAVAYRCAKGIERPLRLIVSSEPMAGWGPLNILADLLAEKGAAHVYRVPLTAKLKPTAKDVGVRVARIVKGFSGRVVDVTDAPPYAVAALYSAGVRVLTVLVATEYAAFFQKFSFTLPL